MAEKKRPIWKMPAWMEPCRELFANTGGNGIEDLMNDQDTNGLNNSVRSALIVCVESQVILLTRMRKAGMLAKVKEKT